MKLTPITERYILHWGEMGSRWGVNRSVAQIHALLYLSPEPMNAEDIAETLSLARSNVSNSIKELQSWNLVQISHRMGDRRDFFKAHDDLWEMFLTVADGRKRREIDPALTMLRQSLLDAEDDKDTDPQVIKRIENMLEFTEILATWYSQMRGLKIATLKKILKLGSKVVRFLPK